MVFHSHVLASRNCCKKLLQRGAVGSLVFRLIMEIECSPYDPMTRKFLLPWIPNPVPRMELPQSRVDCADLRTGVLALILSYLLTPPLAVPLLLLELSLSRGLPNLYTDRVQVTISIHDYNAGVRLLEQAEAPC